ncbi:MAG: AAA family ATPase, partial [Chlamydiales bacterium]
IGTSDYTWEIFPVLWFDFSALSGHTSEAIERSLQNALLIAAEEVKIPLQQGATPADTLISLIRQAGGKNGVVILVDEYDHPLLKSLEDSKEIVKIRDLMNEFYTVIKSLNRFIRYVFITGVSKFSKVSLFSGMNHLKDLTLDPNFSSIAGITEKELDANYSDWIGATAEKRGEDPSLTRQLIRQWYNGYCFSHLNPNEKVYNPVSLHLFFDEARLSNFWFGTATPSFAINLIRSQNYPLLNLENGVTIGSSLEEHHEVTSPNLIPLLFQTGYLTISHFDEESRTYHLVFPNEEVRLSFFDHLLTGFTSLDETRLSVHFRLLSESLHSENLKEFFEILNGLFSEIPYTLHIAKEAYYHSLIYLVMRAIGLKVESEVTTSLGRLDLIVSVNQTLYIFEFKFDSSAQEALQQIIDKKYVDRYKNVGQKIILVGVNVNRQTRSIDDWIEKIY